MAAVWNFELAKLGLLVVMGFRDRCVHIGPGLSC